VSAGNRPKKVLALGLEREELALAAASLKIAAFVALLVEGQAAPGDNGGDARLTHAQQPIGGGGEGGRWGGGGGGQQLPRTLAPAAASAVRHTTRASAYQQPPPQFDMARSASEPASVALPSDEQQKSQRGGEEGAPPSAGGAGVNRAASVPSTPHLAAQMAGMGQPGAEPDFERVRPPSSSSSTSSSTSSPVIVRHDFRRPSGGSAVLAVDGEVLGTWPDTAEAVPVAE
jgi:hypothetical protein